MSITSVRPNLTAQIVEGELKCVLAGAAYTVGMASSGAVIGGIVGGAAGCTAGAILGVIAGIEDHGESSVDSGEKTGFEHICHTALLGSIVGVKCGGSLGAAVGAFMGFGEGASYTLNLCYDYAQKRQSDKTKEILQQLLNNFYEKRSDNIRIFCPVNCDVMLYPARTSRCAIPHLYELKTLYALLEPRGVGHCPECRVSFQAQDIKLSLESKQAMIPIVQAAFRYLASIDENKLAIQQLQRDLGFRITAVCDYFKNRPPVAPLPTEIERDISEGKPLSIDTILTLYPAFHKLCLELNESNKKIQSDLLVELQAQLDNGEITQIKYDKQVVKINDFATKNRIAFRI